MNTPTTAQIAVQRPVKPSLKRSIAHQISRDPFLDWVLILAISLSAALALVGVGLSVYLETKGELESGTSTAPKSLSLPIDQKSLDQALKAFEDSASRRADILKEHAVPRDPSLP